MKAKLATWYLLILLVGNISETFSTLGNLYKENETASFGSVPIKSVTSENPFGIKRRYDFNRESEKQESWQTKVEKRDKGLLTNLTILGNVKKEDKYQSKLSPIGDYVFGSLLLVACVLALLGNGFALSTFQFRQRRLIPIEVFFINLAVVNFLLSVTSYPLSIIASFKHGWNFRELGCTIYAFCCYFLGLSSIYTITAMAFTRYLITCKPVQGNQISCLTCCKMIAMGYLLAFILAGLPLLGFGNYDVEPFGLSCTLDWIAKDIASRIYLVLVTIFCVLFPLVILIFCYSQIIWLVKQSNGLMQQTGVNKRNADRTNAQLTWISGLISAGFVIAWFPYTIACLWTSFQGEMVLPIWISPGPALFAKSSIVYNPFIYVFLTARYQQDFYDLVRYISCKTTVVKEEDTTHDTKNITATNKNGSAFHQSEPCTIAFGIEDDTEISKSFAPVAMKQTCV